MKNRTAAGFTFIEILTSLLVFSIGMFAYMNYQGRASAMMFDTESSSIATAIMVEAAEELNSLSEDDFRGVVTAMGSLPTDWMTDAAFKTNAAMIHYTAGPFDEFGRPVQSGGNSVFYRAMRILTYNDLTNQNFEVNSPLEVLRVVEIAVMWPNKESLISIECNTMPPAASCNMIRMHLIKPIFYY